MLIVGLLLIARNRGTCLYVLTLNHPLNPAQTVGDLTFRRIPVSLDSVKKS